MTIVYHDGAEDTRSVARWTVTVVEPSVVGVPESGRPTGEGGGDRGGADRGRRPRDQTARREREARRQRATQHRIRYVPVPPLAVSCGCRPPSPVRWAPSPGRP